ncbi:MAG: response regulator transcription factor [Dehalococcoidia bacterium]|jgi:two-component system KDP operon response regulator KdpE
MSGARILVVDDDPAILKAVNKGLSGAGFDVTGVSTARDVLREYQRVRPDVVVLDLVLPDGDGISVCAEIRKLGATPVIVLSAIGDDERKVEALNTGADDYLVKPFSMAELQARINVAIRRSTPQASTRLAFDVIELDLLSRKVTAGGVEVRLTPTEFELLRLLLSYPGRVFTQRHLLATVWGPEYQDDAHILRTFVHQLRAKLSAAAPGSGALIVNDPGIGYRIEPRPPSASKS